MSEHLENIRRTADRAMEAADCSLSQTIDAFQHIKDEYERAKIDFTELEQEIQRLREIIDMHNKIYGGTYYEVGTE